MQKEDTPVPGFENEYVGRNGYERKIHKTHFSGMDRKLKHTDEGDSEWIEVSTGKWVLRKKRI